MSNWFSNIFGNGGDTVSEGRQKEYPSTPTEVKSFDVAMTQSAFWAGVRLLTETVSVMPLVCYERDLETNVKSPKTDNDLWELLNYRPNRYQTKIEFFEQLMLNLVVWGNAYVVKQISAGRIVSLMVYPSSQVDVFLMKDGSIVYEYKAEDGSVKIFSEDSIWHIKIFGNGIVGLSPLLYAGNALGLSKDLADRQGTLAANGGKTNGVLTIDQALTAAQKESIKESYKGLNEGDSNSLFVLEAGFKYQQTSLSPTDMQLLESRKYSVEDLARFIGVPSVLINDTSGTTTWGSGIAEINMGFYKLNVKPYLERIELSMKVNLMPREDWKTTDIEFNFDSLLRADMATRLDAQSKAVNASLITPNEGRAEEGRPPKAGGDNLYMNGSLVELGSENGGINE